MFLLLLAKRFLISSEHLLQEDQIHPILDYYILILLGFSTSPWSFTDDWPGAVCILKARNDGADYFERYRDFGVVSEYIKILLGSLYGFRSEFGRVRERTWRPFADSWLSVNLRTRCHATGWTVSYKQHQHGWKEEGRLHGCRRLSNDEQITEDHWWKWSPCAQASKWPDRNAQCKQSW